MDALDRLDVILKTAPWLVLSYFAKRSIEQLEERQKASEIKDDELMKVLAALHTKIEVVYAMAKVAKHKRKIADEFSTSD